MSTAKQLQEIISDSTDQFLDRIVHHPFLHGLKTGSLVEKKFHYFLQQDILFLEKYEQILEIVAKRCAFNHRGHISAFITDCRKERKFLSSSFPNIQESRKSMKSRTTFIPENRLLPAGESYFLYMLNLATNGEMYEAFAAILASQWIFQRVCQTLGPSSPNSYYKTWLQHYAEHPTPKEFHFQYPSREHVSDIYCQCLEYEFLFFEACFRMEKWPSEWPTYGFKTPHVEFPSIIMTISGFDSSGGAGVSMDSRAIEHMGCHPVGVLSALTCQNSFGVQEVLPLSPDFVQNQMNAILSDIGCHALKVGMLHSPQLIQCISENLKYYFKEIGRDLPIVCNPCTHTTTGHNLSTLSSLSVMMKDFFPLCTIIIPTLDEAREMLKIIGEEDRIENLDHMQKSAKTICTVLDIPAVLITGRDDDDIFQDVLYLKEDHSWDHFEKKKVGKGRIHGAGCCLSSIIACELAKGETIRKSVNVAEDEVEKAIDNCFSLGRNSYNITMSFQPPQKAVVQNFKMSG